jgi:hypothetical protein
MKKMKMLVAAACCLFAGAALAQDPCGDCRKGALAQHRACNAAAKDAAAGESCGRKMSDLMQACQVGACARDVAKIYSGYCDECMQKADTPAKKQGCEESVCRKAAPK